MTDEDRKLLEAAAKAAGLSFTDYGMESGAEGLYHRDAQGIWNPLTDDGDAFRLAVKLQMRVTIDADFTGAGWEAHQKAPTIDGKGPWGWKEWHYPMSGPDAGKKRDPCAATRRAITRAAAAMGEKL